MYAYCTYIIYIFIHTSYIHDMYTYMYVCMCNIKYNCLKNMHLKGLLKFIYFKILIINNLKNLPSLIHNVLNMNIHM